VPKIRPRLRHVFIAILGIAVLVSTFGSILDTLDFNNLKKEAQAEVQPRPGKARITSFQLQTPMPPAAGADAKDGGGVDVVAGQEVSFSLHVEGVKLLYVVAAPATREPAATASAKPDANGDVLVSLRLPQAGSVYDIQAYGIVKDKLIPGWKGGYFKDQPAVASDVTLRLMAK
jgi:hypothetical protein